MVNYIVCKGDSLQRIARLNGVRVEDIYHEDRSKPTALTLRVGQMLILAGAKPVSATRINQFPPGDDLSLRPSLVAAEISGALPLEELTSADDKKVHLRQRRSNVNQEMQLPRDQT